MEPRTQGGGSNRSVYMTDEEWEAVRQRAAENIAKAGDPGASSSSRVIRDAVRHYLGLDTANESTRSTDTAA